MSVKNIYMTPENPDRWCTIIDNDTAHPALWEWKGEAKMGMRLENRRKTNTLKRWKWKFNCENIWINGVCLCVRIDCVNVFEYRNAFKQI